MKRAISLIVLMVSAAAISAMLWAADAPKAEQPKETERFDPNGRKLKPGEQPAKPTTDKPTRKKARFELYHETAQDFKWAIDVEFDPRVYPYKILGGSISGSICGSPNWEVTGGSFGAGLVIKAKNTKPQPNCSEFVAITGSATSPSTYGGTYYFSQEGIAENPQNRHNTLLVAFADP